VAIFLNNKVGFKVGATPVDFSDHVTAFTLTQQADQLEVTAMGDTAHKFVTGLSADTITVTLLNDTAAGSILATLQAAYGTTVAFKAIQDTTAAVSATNVLYTGTILVDNFTPINGAVADEAMIDITFTCNSKTAVATTGTWA
jgi:aconitase B